MNKKEAGLSPFLIKKTVLTAFLSTSLKAMKRSHEKEREKNSSHDSIMCSHSRRWSEKSFY